MKIPKKRNKYCNKCKKYTEHSVELSKAKGRSSSHPLSRGSTRRIMLRGLRKGFGNLGRYSKPAISKFKRTGAKTSKKIDLRLKCLSCNKYSVYAHPIRTKKPTIE